MDAALRGSSKILPLPINNVLAKLAVSLIEFHQHRATDRDDRLGYITRWRRAFGKSGAKTGVPYLA